MEPNALTWNPDVEVLKIFKFVLLANMLLANDGWTLKATVPLLKAVVPLKVALLLKVEALLKAEVLLKVAAPLKVNALDKVVVWSCRYLLVKCVSLASSCEKVLKDVL